MSSLYTPPGKAARSLLIHGGVLSANQNDGGVVPPEYVYTTQTVWTYTNHTPVIATNSAFVDFDSGVMQASAYDEAVFDVQPVVTWNNVTNALSVSTTNSAQAYSQIAASGTPFWVAIDPQGYNLGQLKATAAQGLAGAQAVMSVVYTDLQNRQMLHNFLGFAFMAADLNIMFSDQTVITRTFQSTLVQQCWTMGVGACMVTARPMDHLSLTAPLIAPQPPVPPSTEALQNPNSGVVLAHPLLGCNLAIRDKVVVVYPDDTTANINGSIVVGQLSSLVVPNNRDPGVSPNLDVAYVFPFSDSEWTVDGAGGIIPASPTTPANLALAFAAAYGVTSLGLMNVGASTYIPAPVQFMPQDSSVNVSGKRVVWAAGGAIYVVYGGVDANGNAISVQRQFSAALVETANTGPLLQ